MKSNISYPLSKHEFIQLTKVCTFYTENKDQNSSDLLAQAIYSLKNNTDTKDNQELQHAIKPLIDKIETREDLQHLTIYKNKKLPIPVALFILRSPCSGPCSTCPFPELCSASSTGPIMSNINKSITRRQQLWISWAFSAILKYTSPEWATHQQFEEQSIKKKIRIYPISTPITYPELYFITTIICSSIPTCNPSCPFYNQHEPSGCLLHTTQHIDPKVLPQHTILGKIKHDEL